MTAYLINIALLCVEAFIFLYWKGKFPHSKNAGRKTFVFLASLQWILLSGLRNLSVGADTIAYEIGFANVRHVSWSTLWKNFVEIYFQGGEGKDPGYDILVKFFQLFFKDYRWFLIFIAVLFTVLMGIWIYNNSRDVFLSFLLYSCLFYSFFAITGHRQTIATAITVFIGYHFIKKRKLIPFLLVVLLSIPIHKSAIAFLPFYFFVNKKLTKGYLTCVCVAVPILFLLKEQLMYILGLLVGYESYGFYAGAGTWTFSTMFLGIFIVALWRRKEMLQDNPQVQHAFNAMILALFFLPLTFVNPSAMRALQYYSLFLILLIPDIVQSFKSKERVLVFYICCASLIFLMARSNPQYLFMWQ